MPVDTAAPDRLIATYVDCLLYDELQLIARFRSVSGPLVAWFLDTDDETFSSPYWAALLDQDILVEKAWLLSIDEITSSARSLYMFDFDAMEDNIVEMIPWKGEGIPCGLEWIERLRNDPDPEDQ